jgi:thiol-disulfide isomerase/thioredoxin
MLALAFALLACSLSVRAQSAATPALVFNNLSGQPHTLADYRGKIIVLNFWATWCLPCREETPMLSKLATSYADKDIAFLAVSLDDAQSQPKIPRFLEKKKITLPVFTGASPTTLHDFQLGEILPATIILDRDGSPIFRIMGQASKKDVASRLDWLLSPRSSNPPKPLLKNF